MDGRQGIAVPTTGLVGQGIGHQTPAMSTDPAQSRIRYAHTNLIARDWRAIMDFYIEVFDCEPVSSERDHHGAQVDAVTGMEGVRVRGRHLRLPGHGVTGPTLEVFQYEPALEAGEKRLDLPGFAHLAFEVPDVNAWREKILARGGRDVGKVVTLDIAGAGKLALVYVTDPEGNILELQQWQAG